MFGVKGPKKKQEAVPRYPCRKLSPEEIERVMHPYTPPLSEDEILAKRSIPSPDRSHWKDKK